MLGRLPKHIWPGALIKCIPEPARGIRPFFSGSLERQRIHRGRSAGAFSDEGGGRHAQSERWTRRDKSMDVEGKATKIRSATQNRPLESRGMQAVKNQ
jgi:hypothetical protein